jgi:Rrf2 family protein
MRFSHQVYYAVCSVFDLAYNGFGRPVQVRIISERQGIPTRYLEQIFQRLRRGQIVKGRRGPGGGYVLALDPADISLRQIIEAVEGPVGQVSGELARGSEAADEETVPGRPDFLWPLLSARVAEVLAEFSVAELCHEAARNGVPRLGSINHDYQI